VKKVYKLSVGKKLLGIWDADRVEVVSIEVTGSGFLYKMVRNMVGSLVEVGIGKHSPEWIKKVMLAKDRGKAGRTAPPQGLCLIRTAE
jgi:tRNA pseudouridine38-40 synthase